MSQKRINFWEFFEQDTYGPMNHDKVDELSRRLEALETYLLQRPANHSSSVSKDSRIEDNSILRIEDASSLEFIETLNAQMRTRMEEIESENARLLEKICNCPKFDVQNL